MSIFGAISIALMVLTSCGGKATTEEKSAMETTKSDVSASSEATDGKIETKSDCDEFIKNYEVFVDDYTEIMKKYKKEYANPEFIKEYEGLMQKANLMKMHTIACTDPKYAEKVKELSEKMNKALEELK